MLKIIIILFETVIGLGFGIYLAAKIFEFFGDKDE